MRYFTSPLKTRLSGFICLLIFSFIISSCAKKASDEEDLQAELNIEVNDATKWTLTTPDGEVSAGATVNLYRTKQEYKDAKPYKTATTNTEGVAGFTVPAGNYFIVAEKNSGSKLLTSNITIETVNGADKGYALDGIFQTKAEITAAPIQTYAKPGNFKKKDINGDGIVNDLDLVELPYLSTTVKNTPNTKVRIFIGSTDNVPGNAVSTVADLYNILDATVESVYNFQKQLTLVDEIVSGEVSCDGNLSAFCSLSNRQNISPADANLLTLWNLGLTSVTKANTVLYYASYIDLAASDKKLIEAEAKALRGYLYFMLGAYFDRVPIVTELITDPNVRFNLPEPGEVSIQAIADLRQAEADLPLTWPTEKRNYISKYACKGLIAKLLLKYQGYDDALAKANEIINSNRYSLSADTNAVYFDLNDGEVLWNAGKNENETFFMNYLGRAKYQPILRLSEIYLIKANVLTEKQQLHDAYNVLKILVDRKQNRFFDDQTVLLYARRSLSEVWQYEMRNEGSRYFNLVRWQTVWHEGPIAQYRLVLPIPQHFLDTNPGNTQTYGY
ncbi:RagB/SusD family nutrient uptake outer membrane protein [Mucilaginibacter gynuensis]